MGKGSWGSGWWGNSTWVRTGTPWRTGRLWLWTMLIHVASFSWSGFETTRNFLQCSPWWKQYIFLPPHTYTLSHSLGSLLVSSFFWRNHCFSMQSSYRRFVSLLDLLSSVQFSSSVVSDSLQPHDSQHARPPCPSQAPGVYSNPCPSSWWCHPTMSSSVLPFCSCPQSLPASGSFSMSQLFTWGGQRTGVSASASVLPVNTQDWSPLGWTGWVSLQSKGLSRVFSNTTVQKHQFFDAQLSSQSNSHIHTWLEKP